MFGRSFLVAGLLLLLAGTAPAAVEFDLTDDFSTATNPFGPWVLWRAPGQPFPICQADYLQNGQHVRAWADEPFALPMHVPVWGPAPADGDYIWAHGAEFDRTGTNVTSAVWTSPAAGTVTMRGAVCEGARWGRWMRWQLWHEQTLLTGGDICSPGTYTSDHPWDFAAGSGGGAALVLAVQSGERIELRLTSLSEGGNLGESLLVRWHLSLGGTSPAALPTVAVTRLLPPAPNPFNPRTTLTGEVAHGGPATLAVFDLAGRLVRTLLTTANADPGPLVAEWDGRDDAGRACPSGRYVARLTCVGGGDAVGLTLAR
ncbi:hypothetical protein FJ250_09075 [bacterium]|nr:hypothetical protein [bacterium]